ncbi:hypothetical protein ZWY2020_026842 [Hordeum vulgare]|nr:hypothetical protein ZWY2020_026842 [Hordeum vulgare]
MRQAYRARFGCYLEHDVAERTYGDHQKLLLAYLGSPVRGGGGPGGGGARRQGPVPGRREAAGHRRAGLHPRLHRAQLGAPRRRRRRIPPPLRALLDKAVKSETSGTFELGLLTILRCAESPARHFAKVLHKAMKGLGTSDTALIRVVVTRAEVDMQYIKAEYHKKYKRSLADAIHSETSGNYRTFLLSLVGRDR